MKKIVTRDSLQALVERNNPALVMHTVGRALSRIYERQTAAEQVAGGTIEANGVGFTGADGDYGSWCAKLYNKEKRLAPKTVAKWLKKGKTGYSRITKYHAQLNEVAVQLEMIKNWN